MEHSILELSYCHLLRAKVAGGRCVRRRKAARQKGSPCCECSGLTVRASPAQGHTKLQVSYGDADSWASGNRRALRQSRPASAVQALVMPPSPDALFHSSSTRQTVPLSLHRISGTSTAYLLPRWYAQSPFELSRLPPGLVHHPRPIAQPTRQSPLPHP